MSKRAGVKPCLYCGALGEPELGFKVYVCSECLDKIVDFAEKQAENVEARARSFRKQVGGGVG